ncbi:MAG: PAS domain S-box protein [Halanaerobacter sp.]
MGKQEELIKRAYDSVPMPILVIDESGLIEYLNNSAKKTNLPLAEGLNFFNYFDLAKDELLKDMQELNQGIKNEFSLANRFKFSPYPTADKKIVVTLFNLVEEVAELESKLAAKDNLLTDVIDTVPDIVGILNPDYSVEKYNQAGYELLSITEEEVKNSKCYQNLSREKACSACPNEEILEIGELVEKEKYVEELDKFFQVRSAPIFDENGEIIKIIEYLRDITEKKETEESLANRSQLLEGILESIDGGISVLDAELNIKYVNQTMKDWNSDRLPLEGDKCYRSYHGRDKPCEVCPTIEALKSGETVTEILVDDQGSEFKFFKVSSYPLKNKETGQPTEVVEFIQDVTEQQEQKEKLRAIYEASKDVSFIITEPSKDGDDAKIIEFSPGAENIFGYKKEEVLGKSVSILHDEEVTFQFEKIHQTLFNGNYWSDEVELVRKDGRSFPALFTVYPLKIHGSKQATLGVTIDISELKSAKEELRLNKLAVDKADLGIYRVNREIRIAYANERACEQLNYTKEELIGKSVLEIDINLTHEEMDKVWEEVKEQGATTRKTYHRTKDGEEIPVQITIYYVEFRGAEYQYAFVKDITKEERVKDELKEKNKNLERTREKLLKTNQKLSNQLQRGKEIHQHLLPNNLLRSANIKMSSFYRPAEEIGADFFQTMEFDNQLLFYVSDVIGHNLDGAFLNIFLRETIRSFLSEKTSTAGDISLKQIIDYIIYRYRLENFPDDYFISLSLFLLNKDTLQLDYLNAGMHIKPFLIRNGELSRLEAKGMPISNFSEVQNSDYEKRTLHFTNNDTLIITTDGLIEAEKDGMPFGEERLEDILQSNYQIPLEILLLEIIKDLEDFKGNSPIKDDMTLLALKNQKFIDNLSLEIASQFEEAYKVKAQAEEFLTAYYQEIDEILIGLHEAIINAVEHGNQQKYSSKIKVDLFISEDGIMIEVEDEGKGFAWRDKLKEEFSLNNFSERGRGIMISKKIFDYFGYNQLGNRAVMYLSKITEKT